MRAMPISSTRRWSSGGRHIFARPAATALSLPHVELAYGPDERNRIDLFPAPGAAPDAPVLVAIHGGLWFLFDKWMMHFLAPAWTAAGVHVACPNYRLAPDASLDEIVADCRRAIGFLHLDRADTGIGVGTDVRHRAFGGGPARRRHGLDRLA